MVIPVIFDMPPAGLPASASDSGRAAWSGDCRAAGARRRSTPLPASELSSSGSPDQITTSARRFGARLPIPCQARRLPRAASDHGEGFAPGDAGGPRQPPARPGCRHIAAGFGVARVIIVDHPDRDLDAGGAHPADIGLGRGQHLEARRQVVQSRGDHPAAIGDQVGNRQPSLAPTSAILSPGNSWRRSSSTLSMSLARSTWTSNSWRPRSTGTSARHRAGLAASSLRCAAVTQKPGSGRSS